MGRNVVRNLKRGKVTPPPHTFSNLTDGTAVCNCPRGGNEAMQIEAQAGSEVVVLSHQTRGTVN